VASEGKYDMKTVTSQNRKPPETLIVQIATALGSPESQISIPELDNIISEVVSSLSNYDEITLSRAKSDLSRGFRGLSGLSTESKQSHIVNDILKVLKLCKVDEFETVVFTLAEYIFDPLRYVGRQQSHKKQLKTINELFIYLGYQITEAGKAVATVKPNTHKEAKAFAENLKNELRGRSVHDEILQYCNEDLLQMNYFGAIFEATKGISERLRKISGFTQDGRTLVFKMFSAEKNKPPKYSINDLATHEDNESHFAFQNLLSGIVGMFRNPYAHKTKKSMALTEIDALDALTIISYAHKMIDEVRELTTN